MCYRKIRQLAFGEWSKLKQCRTNEKKQKFLPVKFGKFVSHLSVLWAMYTCQLIKELSSLYDLEVQQNYILLILLSFASSFTWVLGFGYMYWIEQHTDR